VPIERIRVGDKVWSRNRTTGQQELKTVTALTAPHWDTLIELRIEGAAEPLRPSLDHPFWVRRASAGHEAWIEAGAMLVGDLVLDRGGNWRKVLAVKPLEGLQTVYNFEVDGDHDYYVGKSGVLVHNALLCNPKLVYRGGSGTPSNLTPRPGVDTSGLSTFDNLEAATPPGGKAQIIDVSKLNQLSALPDAPPPGHVSITPGDQALIDEWAATRGTDTVHSLTQELMDAIIGEARRP